MPIALTGQHSAQWQEYGRQVTEYLHCQEAKHKEETIRLETERDVAIRRAANQATLATNAPSTSSASKQIVKTQGKKPDAYSGGSYAKFDGYIIEKEHQFVINNILDLKTRIHKRSVTLSPSFKALRSSHV